jgi:hypothetical protein
MEHRMTLHLNAPEWARLAAENKTLEEAFGAPTDEAIAAPETTPGDVAEPFAIDFRVEF